MICYMPNFDKRGGLVTVVVQDATTKAILMVAYTDEAGFLETVQTGEAVFYSTSRKERWKKGETSGDVQIVQDVLIDCDGDAVIYLVDQTGRGACHTGARSCFYRRCVGCQYVMPAPKLEVLSARDVEVCERLLKGSLAPAGSVARGNRPAEDEPLRFVLPTGSLAQRTMALLQQMGYALADPDVRGYCGTSNGVEFYSAIVAWFRSRFPVPLMPVSRARISCWPAGSGGCG
ncbi:MAG: phosphoribosyl-AMP cyclohydrolase [Candidatus Peribacteraceae bacterium]|nr:phosphoribosyl-AMP cyclohydrolase [Candidatus Peribacteraceae bacterium]